MADSGGASGTSKSSELEELELLERVFLRLGAAESDDRLETCLSRFLAPTILKITSEHKSVQDKVLELLTHINKRLKSRPHVPLPLTALLSQFRDEGQAPQVVNFSLVYIKLGFPRLCGDEQGQLIPSLIHTLDGKTTHQQDSVLQLVLPSLSHLVLPENLEQKKELLQLKDRPVVRATLLKFMKGYLLLPYGNIDTESPSARAPPGLSQALVTRLTAGSCLQPDHLEKTRLAILKLLSSEIFSSDEVVLHFLIAAGDNRHNVSDKGDHHLKQFGSSADWESSTLVSDLYSLYQGTVSTPGKRTRSQSAARTSPRDHVTPASLRVKLRIVPYFTKSGHAANCFPASVQVIFDGLFGGLTNPKLRTLCLQFVHHLCSRATKQKLSVMAPVLLTGLNKIVDQPDEDPKLQALAYTAIGKIAKSAPFLFQKDTKQLAKLFAAVKKEPISDLNLAIQECLSLLSLAYRGVKGQSALILEGLLLENIYSDVSQCRLMATKCACSMFPFKNIPSRFVCIIACGDSKEEVREEGRKGLKKVTWEQTEDWTSDHPDFCDMVTYLHRRAKLTLESDGGYATAAGKLPFPPSALSEGLRFLQVCLMESAGVSEENKLNHQTLVCIREYLLRIHQTKQDCLTQYVDLLKQSLGPAGDADLYRVAISGLLEAVACSPADVALTFKRELTWTRGFTHSSRTETRESAARLLGILACQLDDGEFTQLAQDLLKDASNEQVFSVQLGALTSLGYVMSNCLTQDEEKMESSGNSEPQVPSVSLRIDLTRQTLSKLAEIVSKAQISSLCLAAVGSLGEIFKSGPLPLPDKPGQSQEQTREGADLSKSSLVECLTKKLESGKDAKVKGRCALSLGFLSVGDPTFPHKKVVLEALFGTREEKAIDLHFTVGEAIACTAAGSLCTAARDQWEALKNERSTGMTGEGAMDVTGEDEIMSWTVETLLDRYTQKTSPIVRQTACVWLLSLVKHTSGHPVFQRYMKRIQMTFMNMLTEKSDVTQEVASRGMGLVYEMSPATEKEELVKLLVGTLVEGRKSGVEVTGETELFQKEMLGKTPHGGNVSTYKELCSLASDLNKPDLVYKFMHLANHHALWNSKKGAAFGFSSIAVQAQEQLAPYLSLLVPRLYRYKFDPNPNIQLAMANIWSAVVPESKKAVDKYQREILADLKANLNSSQWRNRESSCVALGDLLSTLQVGEVAEDLPELWEMCLRARDDIKESVRKAAAVACKSLHKVTVRVCDGTTMSITGTKVIQSVLPLLLDKGMSNPSSEVRAISLVSILKMSQNAGALLKPHVAVLVPTLLESLSSLEPQTLNTISLQYSGENAVQEKLDDLRVAASKSSPMMEIVNLCVQQVDSECLGPLIPRLVDVIKRGVGLGTKVAASQVVILLVHHCLLDLTPYAGKLLNALLSGLSDRSAGVRKGNAKAIGHLVKIAKDSSVTKMIGKLKTWYFEKDDTNIQSGVALVFHATVNHSHDAAANNAAEFLPLIFLAMHAQPIEDDSSSAATVKLWEETWAELVPGTQAGVRLYLPELLGVACSALQAQLWRIKAQGASALATITENMGSNLKPPHLANILDPLLSALQGRVWDGKVSVLKALKTLCVSCKESLLTSEDPNQPSVDKVIEGLLSQCKKRDHGYKAVAIETTGIVLDSLKVDKFTEFYEQLSPILDKNKKDGDKVSDDESMEDRRSNSLVKLDLQAKAFVALGKAWPSSPTTQCTHYSSVCELLSNSLTHNNWKLQVAILSAFQSLFQRLKVGISDDDQVHIAAVTVPAMCSCLGNVRYSSVRKGSLLALDKLTGYLQDNHCSLPAQVVVNLKHSLELLKEHSEVKLSQDIITRISNS